MTRDVYAHPFSSYCQKVLIALYENDTPFDCLKLDPSQPEIGAQFASLRPIKHFPVLLDGEQLVAEATFCTPPASKRRLKRG